MYNTISLVRATSTPIPNGGSFTVNLNIANQDVSRGWQAVIQYDSTKLSINPYTNIAYTYSGIASTSYQAFKVAHPGSSLSALAPSVNISVPAAAIISGIGESINGAGTDGVIDTGSTYVTLEFTALGGADNSIQQISFVTSGSLITKINNNGSPPVAYPITANNLSVTIGTPIYPDLTVAASVATVDATHYTVSAVVTNEGTAVVPSGTTIALNYSVNSGAPVALPSIVLSSPLAIGGSTAPVTSPSITKGDVLIVGNMEEIDVTVDPANAIVETNDTNNTDDTTFTVYPNLVVSDVHTTPDQDTQAEGEALGAVSSYTITYTVSNTGVGVAAASQTEVLVNLSRLGGATVACPALDPGETDTYTTGTVNITGSHDVIGINADINNTVAETSNTDNSASEDFWYVQAGVEDDDNDINGTITTVFSFTGPGDVNAWNPSHSLAFTPGPGTGLVNTDDPGNLTMTVNSSKMWEVTGQGQNDGYLTKWSSGGGYVTTVKLHNKLHVEAGVNQGSTGYEFDLNNTTQLLAEGTTEGLNGTSGYSRTFDIDYSQPIVYSDATLGSAYKYHMVVTYVCTTTDY